MDITQNSFKPTLFLVWLICNSVRSTCHVEIQNMIGMVKSPADSIIYIFWLQNHVSGVQNSFLYVCTAVCAIQLCVAVHPFKQKRTVCRIPYRRKNVLSKFTIVTWHHSSPWYTAIKKEETNLNFKVIHNPSSINVNVYIMCICMCVFYFIL